MHGKPTSSARLAAGKSCLFLKLVAGEASPAPPGRGLCPLPTLLKGLCPLDPRKGGGIPPTPLSGAKALYREERGKYGLQGVGTQVCAPSGGEELPILETRCGGGFPRTPREGAAPPSNPAKGGSAPWPPERGEVSPLPPSYGPGGPGGTSRPVTGLDEPPSCLRQGRGVAPQASRFLAYGKSGSSVSSLGRKYANVHGKPTSSARLAAGKSCLFLKLVAGEASPAPPGRGLCPLPTLLKGALPPRPPKGGKYPPYPPLKGRDSAKSKGQNKATTRAEKSSTHTRGRRPKAACAKQSSLPSFLRKKAGGRNVCSLLGMNKYAKWLCRESGPEGPLFLWKQAGICREFAQSIPQKRGKTRVFRKIPGKGEARFPQVKCMLNACGQNVGKKFAPRYLTQDAGAKAPLCPGFCRDLGSCPKRNFILF